MDETEKYKQRLEAIAEKRRLQEEQDRARRDMEDEKLRLQQLKRKSLRDQWLMEGPPLSPNSPDNQSPRSPLWGSQAQEMEKRIDKLQSESQRLAEEEEKLKEQMEDGQTEAVTVTEAGAEMIQDAVVQNGANNATGLETTEDEMKTNQSAQLDETAAVLTNGGGDLETDTNHDAQSNGPVVASDGVISVTFESGLSLGVSEAEPGQVPNVNIDEEEEEEEEEGTLVMRAERVIITDEGDDVPEDPTPPEDQQESVQSEESPLPNPDAVQDRGHAVEAVVKTETFTQPEKSGATEDGDVQGGVKTNGDGDSKAEGPDRQSEDPTSVQVLSPANALEDGAVASVPVYSEVQPSALTPEPEGLSATSPEAEGEAATSPEAKGEAATSPEAEGFSATSPEAEGFSATSPEAEGETATSPEAEGETATLPEGADAALEDPANVPGQFQEVPLTDPQETQRTEARPGEQEPLLSQAKAPDTRAEPAAAASTETHSPTRAGQGEESSAPKHKTCQCCSVM